MKEEEKEKEGEEEDEDKEEEENGKCVKVNLPTRFNRYLKSFVCIRKL